METLGELWRGHCPTMVRYDRTNDEQRKALMGFAGNFLGTTSIEDPLVLRYALTSELFLLQKETHYIGFLKFVKNLSEPEVTISGFYIHNMLRGMGYGKFFLEEFIHEQEKVGITHIRLSVADDNFVALHLYRNLGFVITGNGVDEGIRFTRMERIR